MFTDNEHQGVFWSDHNEEVSQFKQNKCFTVSHLMLLTWIQCHHKNNKSFRCFAATPQHYLILGFFLKCAWNHQLLLKLGQLFLMTQETKSNAYVQKESVTIGKCTEESHTETHHTCTEAHSHTHTVHAHFYLFSKKVISVKFCMQVRDLNLITGRSLESRHLTSMTML